jgi:predicted phage terminase large subunit-like protein
MAEPLTQIRQELLEQTQRQYDVFIKAQRRYVLQDFWEFSKEVIGWKDIYEPLHRPLCNFVQDNRDYKKLILLPRGHLKSSIITIGYTLWSIAKNPKNRILIANGTYPLAATFLSQIKDHLQKNKKFVELFGDLTTGASKWAEDAITVKRKESYEAKEATVTVFGIGGNLVSQHYDIIILDDLVNRENIHTSDRISDVITFYKDVLDLLEPGGELMVIGTRWHEADLYGWILDETNPEHYEYKFMTRTAVEGDYEIVKNSQGGFEINGGEIIFPAKFSREHLNSLLNKGIGDFSAQYLNDPVPSTESIFRYDWKYYEDDDLKGKELIHYIGVDPAFYDPNSRNLDVDYTAFVVVAVDAENNWYVRDIIRQRMQPKEIIDMLFELDSFWKPKTIGIESVAYQKVLFFFAREMMRERNQFLPITELKHAGVNAKSKGERIQALEPRYAVGSIFHSRSVRQITALEVELRRFPRGKTDDVADALADILEIAHPPAKRQEREGRSGFPRYPA